MIGATSSTDPSKDPNLIRELVRATYGGELKGSKLTRRTGAIRWALENGCPPAELPVFLAREGGIEDCYDKWRKARNRERILDAAERTESRHGVGDAHGAGELAVDGPLAQPATASPSETPASEDHGAAPTTINHADLVYFEHAAEDKYVELVNQNWHGIFYLVAQRNRHNNGFRVLRVRPFGKYQLKRMWK
jgi:hypothetical protein